VAEFLSQQWLDEQCASGVAATVEDVEGAATDPATSAVVQHVVNGAPGGTVSYWTRIHHGQVVEAELGETDEPDLTVTVAYEDALRLDRGEMEPSVAYMQGRLKADGDMPKLFALLAASHTART
jgi:hypothetical protein